MPAPRGPIFIICGIDADGEIQAVEISATDELFTAIRENDNIANVRSFFTLDGGPDHEALLTASVGFFFDGEFFRYVKGTHPGGIPHSGPQGWISGAWQKQPILMGYSSRLRGYMEVIAEGAGDYEVLSPIVPPEEVHYINFISAHHNDPVARNIFFYARGLGMNHALKTFYSVASGDIQVADSPFVLGPADQLRIKIYGMADTKKLSCYWWGRIIDIDQ